MRREIGMFATLALAGAASFTAAAKAPEHPYDPFPTGAAPVDHAVYDALPKVQRHRAWIPKSVDLAADFPPPGSQNSLPDCVAWASTYAARSYLYGKAVGHRPTAEEAMSPAYIYNRLRPPGSTCWGTGSALLVDALNLLKTEGTVSMTAFPDNILKCNVPAPDTLKTDAAKYRIEDYRTIDHATHGDWRTPLVLDDIKGALARGVPVVFMMPVGFDFDNFKGGKIYSNTLTKDTAGHNYHAMALVGYDEDKQALHLINSWGARWADGGYGWLSYDTFERLATEAYALEAPSAQPATPPVSPQEALASQLATFQCGSVALRSQDGHPVVEGFGGVKASLDELRKTALAASPDTRWRVAYHPWPQCEAETTLAQPLQAGDVTLAATTDAGAARSGDPVLMNAGDKFGIVAATTADKPYLSVIYLQADGSAVELYRGQPTPDATGKRQIVLGTSGPAQMRFAVGPPYGDEVLIAIASARPLFGSELETYATERQFLTALRAHLIAAPRGAVAAQLLRLRTSAG